MLSANICVRTEMYRCIIVTLFLANNFQFNYHLKGYRFKVNPQLNRDKYKLYRAGKAITYTLLYNHIIYPVNFNIYHQYLTITGFLY